MAGKSKRKSQGSRKRLPDKDANLARKKLARAERNAMRREARSK